MTTPYRDGPTKQFSPQATAPPASDNHFHNNQTPYGALPPRNWCSTELPVPVMVSNLCDIPSSDDDLPSCAAITGGNRDQSKDKDGNKAQMSGKSHSTQKDNGVNKAKANQKEKQKQKKKDEDKGLKWGGRAQGSKNFSIEEMVELVWIIATALPIGGNKWEAVAEEYNNLEAVKKKKWAVRDAWSCRGKFDQVSNLNDIKDLNIIYDFW